MKMTSHRVLNLRASRRTATRRPRDSRRLRPKVERVERRELLTAAPSMSLGVNLNAVDYWTTALMFNDVMKYAYDGWNVVKANSVGFPWNVSGASLPAMDQNGYPIGLGDLKAQGYGLMTYAFTQPLMSYPTGSYTLTFDGKGTVVVTQLGGSQDSGTFTQDGGAGLPHTVNIGASKTGILIAITDSDPTDYVRNIRLIMPGYQDAYQTQPFYQPFMQGLQPFSTLRFMDTMETNDQGITDWSQRTTAGYRTQTKDTGVAVEYMVQLANELHKDMWVNMPYKANDAYVQGFAQYVHDHLDSGLKVYVEYGNENWNYAPGFNDGFQYVQNYSQTHGLSQDAAIADLSKHDWDIWRNIYGEQTGTTFLRVAASQFSNPWHLDQELNRLVATADPSDPDHGFEIVSGAPYFLPDSSKYDASTTTQQIVADALTAATGFGGMIDAFMAVRNKWQQTLNQTIPAIMYEGGFALTASPSSPWYNAYLGTQTDPGMYAATLAYLDELHQHGVDGLIYYNYISIVGPYGPWGAMQALDESTTQTPKYNALVDYAAGKSGFDSLARFSVAGLAGAAAGTNQTITVTALDSAGDTFTGYLGTVHFSSSDVKAGLPADYVFKPADHGVHTFTVTLKSAGSQSVTASDLAYSQLAGTQSGITVTSAAAGAFRVNGFPASVAGVPHNFTVSVTDIYGNPTSDYTGTVRFTTTDWQGVLPAKYTFTAADAGVHTFTATLKAANTQSITVTDTTRSSMTGSQTGIVVSASTFSGYSIWPYPRTASTGVSYTYTVTAVDSYYNLISGYTGTVHFACTDPLAVLPSDYSFTSADKGAHAFNITLNSIGSRLLAVNDVATPSATGYVWIQVSQSVLLNLSLNSSDSNALSFAVDTGTPQTLTIAVTSANGTALTNYAGTVHFTSTDPKAALPPDYTFNAADNGVHVFPFTLKTAGTQSVTATDAANSNITGTLPGIVVSPGPVNALRVAGFPATVAGQTHTFTVTAVDSNGNAVPSYVGTIHFTTTDWEGSVPADYTFTAADKGTHTFNATLRAARPQTITATDKGLASINGSQIGIPVNVSTFNGYSIWPYPKTASAGISYAYTVAAIDSYYNVINDYTGTAHFTSTDSLAVLPRDYTFTTADNGNHVFRTALNSSGSRLLTVNDIATPGATGHVWVQVNQSTLLNLSWNGSQSPSATNAGTPQSLTVTAIGPDGNVLTNYTGTIHFTSTDPKAALPPDYTFNAADNGVHVFPFTLKTAGTQSVTATDAANSGIAGTLPGIVVSPGPVNALRVAGFPATVAGQTHTFTVTAVDPYGNAVPSYVGTIHFTTTDWEGSVPADYTFTAADKGTHTFNATLRAARPQTITATDKALASINGSQIGIAVNVSSFAAYGVWPYPKTASAGVSYAYTVAAIDSYYNVINDYTGTVHFTSTDSLALLPRDYTFTTSENGDHIFNITLNSAGSQLLAINDVATPGATGHVWVQVNQSTLLNLSWNGSQSPSATNAGTPQSLTVTAIGPDGNVLTNYTGTVHFTSTDPKAVLPPDYTFNAADNGVHVFPFTLKTAGIQSVTATDAANSGIAGTLPGIVVSPGPVNALRVAGFPATVAGQTHTFTVTAVDSYGNAVPSYVGTIHFTTTDWEGSVPADYTFTAADKGTHTFSATLRAARPQTITATDVRTGSVAGRQTNISVSAAAFARTVVWSLTHNATAGASTTFTVSAQDAYSNVLSDYLGTVHFSSSDPNAVLPADYTFRAADQGSHSFSATLETAGNQRLSATDVGMPSSNFNMAITITPAAAASLSVTGFPSPTTVGVAHDFVVTVLDAYGNIATDYVGTIYIMSSDVQALLPPRYTFTAADAGRHTFSATIRTPGVWSLIAADTVTARISGAQSNIEARNA